MKEIIKHPLSACIKRISPRSKSVKGYIVIYPLSNYSPLDQFDLLACQYRYTADKLIDFLIDRSVSGITKTPDDWIALPLLNLYNHFIELKLKYLLRKLVLHSEKCDLVERVSKVELKKALSSHCLIDISRLINLIINQNQNSHYFKSFNEISKFIEDLEIFGIKSIPTRYASDKTEKLHKIFEKQSYLNLYRLKENIENIHYSIDDYIEDEIFFCENEQS